MREPLNREASIRAGSTFFYTQGPIVNMLRILDDSHGFKTDLFVRESQLKVGIIDADLLDNGTRHPNLALLKISGYCKGKGHNVRLICDYSELLLGSPFFMDEQDYDVLVLSCVFKFTKLPLQIKEMIAAGFIYWGGTGFDEINGPTLPNEVEHHMPDYHLYDEFISRRTGGDEKLMKRDWDDYLSYSVGFTTRGCIRHCGFCVNRLLNRVVPWSPVEEFLDKTRKCIYLWDDNIMAAPPRVFKHVMESLQQTNLPFQFRQGMDIRLMTDEKAELLKNVRYHGDYIFAFDHYRMDIPKERKEVEQTLRGLAIWRKHCHKSTKLYVLVAYDGLDEKDIEGTFFRIQKLMEFGCLPYIMRFEDYKTSRFRTLYTQLARWCNQPGFFKKMSFRQYCVRNEEYHQGIQKPHKDGRYSKELKFPKRFKPKKRYCACYQAMLDFEEEFPDIAKKYFDLRFEELNPYKL